MFCTDLGICRSLLLSCLEPPPTSDGAANRPIHPVLVARAARVLARAHAAQDRRPAAVAGGAGDTRELRRRAECRGSRDGARSRLGMRAHGWRGCVCGGGAVSAFFLPVCVVVLAAG